MDVVYRVRVGERNEPLRYSLRSLANFPHRRVLVAGFKPSWVRGVSYHYRNQTGMPDQFNSNANLLLALADSELSDEFVLMDDDFYINRPTLTIPVMHQGSLDERIRSYQSGNRFGQAYSLMRTRTLLFKWGIVQPLSYELHMPMVMNKYRLMELFRRSPLPLFALRPRTLYGNVYNLSGEVTTDAKDQCDQTKRFCSSGDFERAVGYLRRRFGTPSPYE
jgi:hypothetical protein